MCTITNKIKLCSCKANSTEKLQHYWALYRKNKDHDFEMFIVGEAMLHVVEEIESDWGVK